MAMLSTIEPDQNGGAILGVNIWLQLGWRPPCEVTKNLVVSVAFSIGHGVIQPFRWLMSTHTGSPKPPKNINLPKNRKLDESRSYARRISLCSVLRFTITCSYQSNKQFLCFCMTKIL
jgi:hypothetical protein